MNYNAMIEAEKEARRFLDRIGPAITQCEMEQQDQKFWHRWYESDRTGPRPIPKAQSPAVFRAAARRASLDLTRALAQMRRP